MKRIICLILTVLLTFSTVFALGSCGTGFDSDETNDTEETTKASKEDEEEEEKTTDTEETNTETTGNEVADGFEVVNTATDFVLIDVKDYGKIVVELYPEIAPITVANFKNLVSEKFYDGLIFHRIIEGFMIQGGGFTENYDQKDWPSIKGEFSANGVENPLKHTRGVISMARTSVMDSASSQFFIMHRDAPHLDGKYAAFGEVISGIEVVDAIASVYTDYYDMPFENIVIEKVRFVTPVAADETLGG